MGKSSPTHWENISCHFHLHLTDGVVNITIVSAFRYLNIGPSLLPVYFKNTTNLGTFPQNLV